MGFPPPGKPYRDLADAALLRRAAIGPKVLGTEARPTIVKRLPLKPPVNTPKPIRIDPAADLEPFPTIPRLGSTPEIARVEPEAVPEPQPISLSSGSVRVGSVVEDEDDDYVSIAMVMPARERLTSATRRTILVLAAILILLLAIWLFRRTATADSGIEPVEIERPAAPIAKPVARAEAVKAERVVPRKAEPRKAEPVRTKAPPPPARPERSRREAPAKSKGQKAAKAAKPPKAPAPPAIAFLTIDAIPYGTVWIDGEPAGQTPLIRVRLPAGAHDVRVVSHTGEGRSFAVDLTAGADVRRRIRFEGAP